MGVWIPVSDRGPGSGPWVLVPLGFGPHFGPRPPPRPQDPFKTANKDPKIANIGPKSGPRPAT